MMGPPRATKVWLIEKELHSSMSEPASGKSSEPNDDSNMRSASFTPAEAHRLFAIKALYYAGRFAEDDPYVPARSDDQY